MAVLLKFRLLFSLGFFLFQIVLEYLKTVRVILLATSLVAILLCLMGITLLSLPKPQPAFPLKDVAANFSAAKQKTYTLDEYHNQLEEYLSIASVQPTHRDLLINISFLYQATDNTEKAREYWLAARNLDPNNPLFLHESELFTN